MGTQWLPGKGGDLGRLPALKNQRELLLALQKLLQRQLQQDQDQLDEARIGLESIQREKSK